MLLDDEKLELKVEIKDDTISHFDKMVTIRTDKDYHELASFYDVIEDGKTIITAEESATLFAISPQMHRALQAIPKRNAGETYDEFAGRLFLWKCNHGDSALSIESVRRGFTLVELLVVLVIISLVSVIVLPALIPALNRRQIDEAARIVQGALVGARDQAIHTGQSAGIRLVPDLMFNGINMSTGLLDDSAILAYNRLLPLEPAPQYTEGMVSVYPHQSYPTLTSVPCLVLEESPGNWVNTGGTWSYLPNSPTSWTWNIRVGDKIQINLAGPWYSVVGPMTIGFGGGNSELFMNTGQPGSATGWNRTLVAPDGKTKVVRDNLEYLLLVDGRDDNRNGWVDEGWDGVDNNGMNGIDEAAEWETEVWQGAMTNGATNVPYAIRRRPMPAAASKTVELPTQVVIDATTWGTSQERSRMPVNSLTGSVDILVNPDGTLSPSTIYASPTSLGLGSSFIHLWLAERQDLISPAGQKIPMLPIGDITRVFGINEVDYSGPRLKGEARIVTLFTRSGRLVFSDSPVFDNPNMPISQFFTTEAGTPITTFTYNPGWPFTPNQTGSN